MVKRVYRLLMTFVAILIALQPLSAPIVQAAEVDQAQRLELIASAERLGVPADFLLNPDAYLADQGRAAAARRDAALSQMDQTYRPSILALALVKAQAEAVKAAHAQSALASVASTLTDLDQLVAQTQANLDQGRTPDSRPFSAFETAVEAALADLDRVEQLNRTNALGPALDNAMTFFAATRLRLSTLQQLLKQAPDRSASPNVWHTYLQQIHADLPAPLISQPPAFGLPISPLSAHPRAPRTSRLDYARDEHLLPALSDLLNRPTQSIQAMLSVLGLLASPSSADLAETPDVHFTSDIRALVSKFQADPIALFNFVHDRVDFDVYYGSKKGSIGTLYEMAGNDVDQASLLIALLRAANIPARYATGRVWLSAQQAQDLTRTTDTHAAADVLTSGGIPSIYVTRPGADPVVEIEHTWVQAWLPYEQYRGVLEKPGASSWIDLDPSIKRYTVNTPVDLRNAVAFSPDSYLSAITTTLPVDVWENNLRAYIQANALECQDFAAASRTRTLLPDNLELLPAQLPALQLNTLATLSQLPATQRYGINVRLTDDQGNAEINFNADLPAIYGQRLDLRFPAATSADQATINSDGGLFNTPAYMVNLSPTLSLSETVVAVGNPQRPGTARSLVATFNVPGLTSDVNQISHQTLAGGVYVLGLDYQSAPQRLLDEAQTRLAALNAMSGDNAAAQRLYVALLTYFRQFNHGRDDVTGILQAGFIRDVGAGFADQQVKVASLYGAPTALSAGAYFLDVPKLSFTFYDLEGGQTRAAQVATLIGYNSSALEHEVWQQQFGQESVSAVKALQLAASQGQRINTISDASQVATLNVDQSIKDAILDALNRGWLAKASQSSITLNQWSGAGYILYDPTLGSAGYLISGGLAGGSTTGGSNPQGGGCGKGSPIACGTNNPYGDAFLNVVRSFISDPVNLSNGNLLINESDLMVPARGFPIVYQRWYNSLSPSAPVAGRLGYGWTDSFSLRVVDNGDGSRSFFDGDGHEYRFAPDGAGGFTRPSGFHRTLQQIGTGYTLTDPAGNLQMFDGNGRLTAMTDIDNNTVTLNYNTNQLTSITDAIGRTALTFSYDGSGRLITVTDVDGRTVRYEYDAANNLTSVTSVANATLTYAYDAQHELTRQTDPLGNANVYVYDADSRMVRHIDPAASAESFSYDPYNARAVATDKAGNDSIYTFDNRGRALSRIDPLGNQTINQWDADDNQVALIDARGHTTTATYDANGRPTSTTDALGNTEFMAYNARGQVTSMTQPTGSSPSVTHWSYDSQGNLTGISDSAGRSINQTYDGSGQLIDITDADGNATAISYGPNGKASQITRSVSDANGSVQHFTTHLAYASGGFLNSITDDTGRTVTANLDAAGHPLALGNANSGNQATLQYDADGQLIQITARNGFRLMYNYDALGQRVMQTDSLSRTLRLTYNPAGQVIAQTDERGNVTRYQYDELGRLVRRINPDGSLAGFGYCANGPQVCESVDENGNVNSFTENALGQVVTQTIAVGNMLRNLYDVAGRLLQMTDAAGHSTSYTYDASGRLVQVIDALNHPTQYTYDPRGPLTSVTDANTHTRNFVFDQRSRLIRATDADGNLTRYFYDGAARPSQVIDANGNSIAFAYDAVGWLSAITGPSGNTSLTRDTQGRVTAQSNGDVAQTFGYNLAGDVLTVTQQISGGVKSLIYTYTPDGQIESLTNAESQTTRYAYDGMNRLVAITTYDGSTTTFAYDAAGRRTRLSLPNGITTYYTYNAANQLTAQVSHNSSGALIAAYTYSYDSTGRRTSMTDLSGRQTHYTYDALGRLTFVDYGGARSQAFTYDAVSNRLTQTVDGSQTSYTYDNADRLLSQTQGTQTTAYTYDHNGNLLTQTAQSATSTFTYDQFNQLTGLALPNSTTFHFGYSPTHQRVSEQATSTSAPVQRMDFLLSGDSVVADYANGITATHYLLGPGVDEVLAQETNGQWVYYLQDGTGALTVATDAQGQTLATRTYDAFGAVLDQVGAWPSRFGYSGREQIGATSLLYYRARTYDATTGRFTSVDPASGILAQPETLHPYVYAKNDPVDLRDPSGEAYYNDEFLPVADHWFITLFGFGLSLFSGLLSAGTNQLGNYISYMQLYDGMIASLMDLFTPYAQLPNNGYAVAWVVGLFVPLGLLELFGGFGLKGAIGYRVINEFILTTARQRAQQRQATTIDHALRILWADVGNILQGYIDGLNDTSPKNWITYTFGDSLYMIAPETGLGVTANLQ